jgi:glyoxylase-like metal-dependent hydrolase (beta-lactamase superfamily II)
MIHIQDFTFNSFQTRCSVVWDDSLSCAIVDPGCSSDAEISELTSFISSRGLKPVCIMLTHGHFDHVLGVADLVSRYDNLPVYMHPADKATLAGNEYFTKWFGASLPASFETVDICEACSSEGRTDGCCDYSADCPSDNHAENPSEDCTDAPSASCTDGSSEGCTDGPDGQKCISVIEVGGLRFKVIETPGHTPGGVSFYEPAEKVLFSGDSLFAGAIGRTDHPGGDYEMLMKSILGKLVTLEGSVSVIPGHGPCTDIAREGMTNPFLLPFNEPYED